MHCFSEELSPKLLNNVIQDVCARQIETIILFNTTSDLSIISSLIVNSRPCLFQSKEIINYAGDISSDIFFILKG